MTSKEDSKEDNKGDNNGNNQIYYLCKNNNDNKCKKLIELASIIALNKLIKNQSYINESNDIAENVINNNIDKLTKKLIVPPMSKDEYNNYEDKNIAKIIKSEEDFNLNMNNMGIGQSYGMGSGMATMEMEHMIHNMPHNMPHMPTGGNISKRKSCKKQSKNKIKEKTKNHKKSKRIRKI
jgi:hypothetical protein